MFCDGFYLVLIYKEKQEGLKALKLGDGKTPAALGGHLPSHDGRFSAGAARAGGPTSGGAELSGLFRVPSKGAC